MRLMMDIIRAKIPRIIYSDRPTGIWAFFFTNLSGSLKGITSRLVSIIKTGVVMLGIR